MQDERLTPSDLLKLSDIVSIMVNLNKITNEEAMDFLGKAGLSKLSDKEWSDTVGTIYTFN